MHESKNSVKILKIVKNSGSNSYPMSICTKIRLEAVSELRNRFFVVIFPKKLVKDNVRRWSDGICGYALKNRRL